MLVRLSPQVKAGLNVCRLVCRSMTESAEASRLGPGQITRTVNGLPF
jgi:hypothetical protein